jgi:hypothetical protein
MPSPGCELPTGARLYMAELVAEQTLIMLHVGVETQSSKWAAAIHEEVSDTAADQDANEVVVKGPPGLMATCHRYADEADGIVNHRCHGGERTPERVARDEERDLPLGEHRAPIGREGQLRPGGPHQSIRLDLGYLIESTGRIADRLAPNSRCFGLSKIGPERLASVAAEIFGVMLRQDQHGPAEPVAREETQCPLVEVDAQRLASGRCR